MSTDQPHHREQHDQQETPRSAEEPLGPVSAELVVTHPPTAWPPAQRWPRALARLRRRLPELALDVARHPAVLATASAAAAVGAGLAVNAARRGLAELARADLARAGAARPTVTVLLGHVVVEHVHVVHHQVVHHLQRPALPPRT